MAKIAVLIGNGLSVALTQNLSLSEISNKFLRRLIGVNPEAKSLLEGLISDKSEMNDFEKCIARVETFYHTLNEIQQGRKNDENHNLEWDKKEKSVRESIYLFSALIVEFVNGNVKLRQIEAQLPGFVRWLISVINGQNVVDLFTLNYDLLLETILLQTFEPGVYMEFFRHAGEWDVIRAPHFYFNPPHSRQKWKNCRVRLYHLHGSISSFKDLNKEVR
ncbi:MAG: hypothetical protein JWM44_1552, partial [Bacilli bacterium]|nr:hypothetical protein [Bacilli bacterium]